jgi:citrate lyase beta subunit
MGYSGARLVHPSWVRAANEGYAPSQRDLEQASYLKQVLEEAYAEGKGSVSVNGGMYDVADIKYVNTIVERGNAIATREREKTDAMRTMGGVSLKTL